MAHSGDELVDSARGQYIIFRQTAQDTDGKVVEVEARYQPGSEAPPAHIHPYQEEYFEVLSGSIHTLVNGSKRTYEAGERFRIPAGASHQMWNGGQTEARLLWQTRPAFHTDDFLEIMLGLAQDGKTSKAGIPNLLQLAVIMRQYRREFRLAKPPLFIQNMLFTSLAFLGRICDYHATYTRKRA